MNKIFDADEWTKELRRLLQAEQRKGPRQAPIDKPMQVIVDPNVPSNVGGYLIDTKEFTKFITGPVQVTHGLLASGPIAPQPTLAEIERDNKIVRDAWYGIYTEAVYEEALVPPFPTCRYSIDHHVPAGDVKLVSIPYRAVHPKEFPGPFIERQNYERRKEARKRVMASVREWPLCNFTDKPVELEWNAVGKAFFHCRECWEKESFEVLP